MSNEKKLKIANAAAKLLFENPEWGYRKAIRAAISMIENERN